MLFSGFSSPLRLRVKDISGAPIPDPSQPEHQASPQTALVLLAQSSSVGNHLQSFDLYTIQT